MPIFEYKCKKCNEEFEKLVFGNPEIRCPKCDSTDVQKKFSVFGMSGVDKPFAGQGGGCSSCGSSGSACSSCG